jgi:glycosyltransferase involved in cell wall biosynthesis
LTGVYCSPTIPTLIAARLLRKPVVWSPRGALQRWQGSTRPRLKEAWEHACNIVGSNERLCLHVTSEEEGKESGARIPWATVVTIPNGVDCDFFSAGHARTRPNSAVFVGTMNWYPNIDAMQFFLREIWPQLKTRVPDASMDIAGSNPPEDLIRLARSLPGVTVHGYLPDVRPLIDSAAVFVCPIRDGGGTKLKILDAFAMNKCVVANPISCEGIDVTAGKDVVLASTPEDFVSQICRLFANERQRVDIGTAARLLVEKHYSFLQIGERLNSTIEQVVQRHETQR